MMAFFKIMPPQNYKIKSGPYVLIKVSRIIKRKWMATKFWRYRTLNLYKRYRTNLTLYVVQTNSDTVLIRK
jgi:hypothetical protein